VRRAFLTYLYGARRLEDAVEEARDAVERDPQEAFYYYLLGKALYQLGRTGEAAEALATCKRLGPAEATAADADAILQRIRANE
jgi:cytochrome c-type biogenesis protein CcmH/NrfG